MRYKKTRVAQVPPPLLVLALIGLTPRIRLSVSNIFRLSFRYNTQLLGGWNVSSQTQPTCSTFYGEAHLGTV